MPDVPLTPCPPDPSPQSPPKRYNRIVGLEAPAAAGLKRKSVNCTLLIVDPAGIERHRTESVPGGGEDCALVLAAAAQTLLSSRLGPPIASDSSPQRGSQASTNAQSSPRRGLIQFDVGSIRRDRRLTACS